MLHPRRERTSVDAANIGTDPRVGQSFRPEELHSERGLARLMPHMSIVDHQASKHATEAAPHAAKTAATLHAALHSWELLAMPTNCSGLPSRHPCALQAEAPNMAAPQASSCGTHQMPTTCANTSTAETAPEAATKPAQGRGPARSRSGRKEPPAMEASARPPPRRPPPPFTGLHCSIPHRASMPQAVPGAAAPARAGRRQRLQLHRAAVPFWSCSSLAPPATAAPAPLDARRSPPPRPPTTTRWERKCSAATFPGARTASPAASLAAAMRGKAGRGL
jgi:hypothetical protein